MAARLDYLPALDGLRAIAVTLVVLYHLDIGWAQGGFLGVDLFFVISGFLITTLLLREHESTGRIAIGDFWIRRFKRLVPALVVLVAATVLATRAWGVPEQWTSVRGDAVAALVYVANWRFVLADQSYFETLLGPSPLLHTWSLAVEEQWYLLWPLAMVGLVALAARRRSSLALAVIVAAAVGSALLMAALFDPADPSRVYYGTDTRAQQLLVGAALAWLVHLRPGLTTMGARTTTARLGNVAIAALVVVAAVTADDAAWLYRGGLLAISVLAAVTVLATATDRVAPPLRWLTAEPLLWIGRRSYGIYLWHWPVIVFVGAPMGIDLPRVPLIALQLGLTLALATASHALVETPARRSSWRPATAVVAWTGAAAVAVVASIIVLQPAADREFAAGDVIRPAALTEQATAPATSRPTPSNPPSTTAPLATPPLGTASAPTTTTTVPPVPTRLLLLGDSTAYSLGTRDDVVPPTEWDLQVMARLGCGTVAGDTIDSDADTPTNHPAECDQWRDEWAESVEAVDPEVAVVMIGAWEVLDHRIGDTDVRFPSPRWDEVVRTGITEAVTIAGSSQAPVALLTVPCMFPSGDEGTTARSDTARVDAFNRLATEVAATSPQVSTVDLAGLLCPSGQVDDLSAGSDLRYDGVHLSPAGAEVVWPWLLARLETVLASVGT
jgi:peptidoglycan/LPS O-acetylase OafA/YrhL